MKLQYHPKTNLEKFSLHVYATLAKEFPQTYFVGGMVRDWLRHKKIRDVDLTTIALPEKVKEILQRDKIPIDIDHSKFGVVRARQGDNYLEIATFRQDLKAANRYPKVRFVKSPRADSTRRDFTVNALYFSPKHGQLLDFHSGLKDLKKGQLKFIGDPIAKIKEDPLRIIRALRLQMQLNFFLEQKTATAIKKCFSLTEQLTRTKIAREVSKLPTRRQKKQLWTIINQYSWRIINECYN